ncbi:MAG TPA: maleylpyruvate isomerase N-terminal domain-containing protein [Candidatus Dormibacteraeota bacterium]|jgi:hypothetical protein
MIAVPVDHAGARAALAELTPRTAALISGITTPARRVTGLEWTLAETAAHVVIGLRGYTDSLQGDIARWTHHIPESPGFRERLTGLTSSSLAEEPSRDPAVLGRRLVDAVDAFLEASAGRSPDQPVPTPWYAPGASLPLGAATCLLLGEQVIHGWDMARTLGRPWQVSREHALLMVGVITTMMPLAVDPEAARGVRAVYALHVRGGPGFVLRIDGGRAVIEPLGAQRIDCHLSGDPVSLAMVGYGRIGQWRAIARGGLLAWGRRPWLGLRMRGFFFNP